VHGSEVGLEDDVADNFRVRQETLRGLLISVSDLMADMVALQAKADSISKQLQEEWDEIDTVMDEEWDEKAT